MVLMLSCECSAASPQTDSTRKGFEILCRAPPHVSTLCLPDDKHLTISPRLNPYVFAYCKDWRWEQNEEHFQSNWYHERTSLDNTHSDNNFSLPYLLIACGFAEHLHVMVVRNPLDGSLSFLIKLTDVAGSVNLC